MVIQRYRREQAPALHIIVNDASFRRGDSRIAPTNYNQRTLIVILSDGEAGVEGSVNTSRRESGFFDFAAYGRFAQNDTWGKVHGKTITNKAAGKFPAA